MNLSSFKNIWNLLFIGAGAIVIPLSGFIEVPYYASSALGATSDYGIMSKFIVAIILALMLVPCFFFNHKKDSIVWAILVACFLAGSIFLWFKDISYKKQVTIDYTSFNGKYIVKGKDLLPSADSLLKEMEKVKQQPVNETDFFAENIFPEDSTGVLTAAALWPPTQIVNNAKSLIYLYLATIILFSITAVCAVQTVYCISKNDPKVTS